jgi:hypothetical protein
MERFIGSGQNIFTFCIFERSSILGENNCQSSFSEGDGNSFNRSKRVTVILETPFRDGPTSLPFRARPR